MKNEFKFLLSIFVLILLVNSIDASTKYWNFDGNISIGNLFIDNNGNIGIGTTEPKSKLDINGGIAIDGKPIIGKTLNNIIKENRIINVSNIHAYYLSMTINPEGLPIMSFYNGSLIFLKCGNLDCSADNTISEVVHGSAGGYVGYFNSLAIGADTLPIISFYNNSGMGYLYVAKCGDSTCSSGNTITQIDTSCNGQYTSIAIGSDGLPIISYTNCSNNDLNIVKCGNQACSSGNTIKTLDSVGWTGVSASLTMGADGMPIIAYRDFSNDDLKVAKCHTDDCSSTTLTTVDSSGATGEFPAITIGNDGLPIIAYRYGTLGYMRVMKCGNQACSSGNHFNNVDTVGFPGFWNSITITPSGVPFIAHHNYSNGWLKISRCGNESCGLNNYNADIEYVQYVTSVGHRPSTTIGPNGNPMVAYYDVEESKLKLLKCANEYCANNWAQK